jgi:hypothetical protein
MSAKLSKCFSVPGMLIAPGSKSIVAPPSSSGITSTGACSFISSFISTSSPGNFNLGTSVRKPFIYICHLNSLRFLNIFLMQKTNPSVRLVWALILALHLILRHLLSLYPTCISSQSRFYIICYVRDLVCKRNACSLLKYHLFVFLLQFL